MKTHHNGAFSSESEMMLDDSKAIRDDRIVGDLLRVHKAGLHLLSLINDILALSKIEAGKVELIVDEFNIKVLISDVINTIIPSIEKNRNSLQDRFTCQS